MQRFKKKKMLKYFVTLVCVPFAVTAQQANTVYYAAPYLQIEDVYKKATQLVGNSIERKIEENFKRIFNHNSLSDF